MKGFQGDTGVAEPLTDEEEALLEELYQQGLVQPDQYGNIECGCLAVTEALLLSFITFRRRS